MVTGKKTAQSLSDSQWFGIERYYAVFKGLAHDTFTNSIESLVQEKYMNTSEDHVYILTEKGEQILMDESDRLSFFKHLNGLKYASIESLCWQAITLFVQALSNALYGHYNYSPVVRDFSVIHKVKSVFPKSEYERKVLAEKLNRELSSVLLDHDTQSADLFVKKLSGYNRIGSTFEQLSRIEAMSQEETVLRFRGVLHSLIHKVAEEKMDFPILYSLIGSFTEAPAITKSATLTYKMLANNKSVEEIMNLRKLKMSTLEDHLVEIAREVKDFPITPYISENEFIKVKDYYRETKETKLRPFKDAFPHLSYFQIRLVLAKEGGKHATGSRA
ncbi:helix-turn-helix domain-containing protein [Fictibacillus nanhaiensis]|uniref:helix-turn-helix domain-containing protein n=1 Tax=Fictibacillus nanhaiensis TaxID=742169 RepID=UPI002E1DC268|nr:helix-turn-helix domain-containing protein [Fictibacillus nanhaiensis]